MAEQISPQSRTPKRPIWIIILILILSIGGLYLYAGWVGYQEAPKFIEVKDTSAGGSDPYALSIEQEDVLLSYGYPDAFTILFYEEETPGQGIQTVRLESWDYYLQELAFTFINGEVVSDGPFEWDLQGDLVPAPYYPEQFDAFMTLDEVIAAGEIDNYIEVPLNKELMAEGKLYYADSLSFGMRDNQLVYIESLALISD